MGGVAGIEQVALGAVADRPVDVLATAVDTGERLLMQQAGETMPAGGGAQHRHDQLLVIGGHVGGLIHRRDLELTRSHLIVAGLGRHAEPIELLLDVLHEHLDPLRNRTEVVVVELLPLGRRCAEQAAAGQLQVGAQRHEGVVHQEVLLLSTTAGVDRCHLLVAEQLEQALRLGIDGGVGTQQWRLLVERLAGPADEHRGDAEGDAIGRAHQPGGAGDIPGGVAAGLEGGAQTAVREGGAIRLTLHQQLAGEFGDGAAIALGHDEAVMLLGREVGQRIEDVGVVEGTTAGGPVLHGVGDHVGHRGIERTALADRALDRLEDVAGQRLLHPLQVEDIAGPDLLQRRGGLDRHGPTTLDGLQGSEALGTGHGLTD